MRDLSEEIVLFWCPFNTGLRDELWTDRSKPHPTLLEPWIVNRAPILEKYALRSFQRQEIPNKLMVIVCHEDSKIYCKEYLGKFVSDDVIISYVNTNEEVTEYIATEHMKELMGGIGKQCSLIQSIRLDSDDYYHPRVAGEVMLNDAEWAYFQWGYCRDWESQRMWSYKTGDVGPFFSHKWTGNQFAARPHLIEPAHDIIHKHKPLKLRDNMFIVGITGSNTCTRIAMKTDDVADGYYVTGGGMLGRELRWEERNLVACEFLL